MNWGVKIGTKIASSTQYLPLNELQMRVLMIMNIGKGLHFINCFVTGTGTITIERYPLYPFIYVKKRVKNYPFNNRLSPIHPLIMGIHILNGYKNTVQNKVISSKKDYITTWAYQLTYSFIMDTSTSMKFCIHLFNM